MAAQVPNAVPRTEFTIVGSAGSMPPELWKRAMFLATSGDGPLFEPKRVGNAARAREIFGEGELTRMAEIHFSLDPNRTAVLLMRLPTETEGAIYILNDNGSGAAGASAVTVDETVTPLYRYQPLIEVLKTGTVGTPGIELLVSADAGRSRKKVKLGVATSYTFDGLGMKFDFGAGDLTAGRVIEAYVEPPRHAVEDIGVALTALRTKAPKISLFCLGGQSSVADGSAVSTALTDLRANDWDVGAILAARLPYPPSRSVITATFTPGSAGPPVAPATLQRDAGSWLTDGAPVRPGMTVIVNGSTSNEALEGTVASVTATTITFVPGTVVAAEIATANVSVLASEDEDTYQEKLRDEWESYSDQWVVLTFDQMRAFSPSPVPLDLDRQWHADLLSEALVSDPSIQIGQVRSNGPVGGPLSSTLNARIYEDDVRIHADANIDPSMAENSFTCLRRSQDLRSGVYVNSVFAMASETDPIKDLVMMRLSIEWINAVRTALTDEVLSSSLANPRNYNQLSEAACQSLEASAMAILRPRFEGRVSNLEGIGLDAFFRVDRASDLSVGISVAGKIITKAYYRKFNVSLTVQIPGSVN